MAYTTDQKFTPSDAKALRETLNEYYNYDGKGWGSAVTFYDIWEKNLDKTAKEEFNRVMGRIKKNKEAMNMAGFYGDFTFYIKQADSTNKLTTCTITF